jgi:hypothetical protein
LTIAKGTLVKVFHSMGYYHNNMNGDIYMKWLKNRLFPSFAAAFPDKQMILVLDNARYHHVRGDDWITPSKLTKSTIAPVMERVGLTRITVTRTDKTTNCSYDVSFDISTFDKKGRKTAPLMKELKAALKQHLTDHPQSQETAVQKLFREKGHSFIYTPAYTPNVHPIELC